MYLVVRCLYAFFALQRFFFLKLSHFNVDMGIA
jgi:hypothetical protein